MMFALLLENGAAFKLGSRNHEEARAYAREHEARRWTLIQEQSLVIPRKAVALIRIRMKTNRHLGGLARAAKLSPAKRSEIARKAAQARWEKAKPTHSFQWFRNGVEIAGATRPEYTLSEDDVGAALERREYDALHPERGPIDIVRIR
jgi:hypothetical protein